MASPSTPYAKQKMKHKINMAVVGLRFGRHITDHQIMSGPAEPFIRLSGVFDLDDAKASAAAATNGVRKYQSFDEILSDPSLEAVGLFTPPEGRASLIKKIIRAGKHVMTTKPFEINAEHALSVLREARSLKRVVHINSPEPLPDGETAQVLAWQEKHGLGRPVAVRWETYTRYNEEADGGWYDDSARCPVAPVFRLGIYGINQLLRLCGRVHSLNVAHSRIFTGRPTPDNAELSLSFANGALGSVFASFCIDDAHRYANTLSVHYEHGTVVSETLRTQDNHDVIAKELRVRALRPDGRVEEDRTQLEEDHLLGRYQWAGFYRAVRSGEVAENEIAPEMIAHSVQVIHAMQSADLTGRRIVIPQLEMPEAAERRSGRFQRGEELTMSSSSMGEGFAAPSGVGVSSE
jgi:predicted dehydrogenase